MTNYKSKKAGGNPRIALWPEKLGKNQNVFFPILFYNVGTIYCASLQVEEKMNNNNNSIYS